MVVSILRKEARENLKGKWKKAILIMIIFFLTTILLDFARDWLVLNTPYGLFANILNIVITITLSYGLLVSYIKLKRNEKTSLLHYIYYSAIDGKKVWKNMGRLLFRTSGYITIIILFGYVIITEIISLLSGGGVRLSFFIEIIVFVVTTILFVMKAIYYALNTYILYDNKTCKSKELLNESERLMKNHRWDFVKMILSFAGWFILGLIFSVAIILSLYFFAKINDYKMIYITYIPLIPLMPYMYITTVCFYDNLLYNNPKPKEEVNNTKKDKKKAKKKNKKK